MKKTEQKGKVGKPPKFKSVKDLQEKIDNYFNSCWDYKRDMFGNRVKDNETKEYIFVQVRPYTICGLAVALDTTRETLLDYEAKDEYSDTIKRAKQRCEQYAEDSLFIGKNPAGVIFNLKNNYSRWRDKIEVEEKFEDITDTTDNLNPDEKKALDILRKSRKQKIEDSVK